MTKGILYLIPTYLDDSNNGSYIAPIVKEVIENTRYFLVENIRTTRRYFSSLNLGLNIEELAFEKLDKHVSSANLSILTAPLFKGHDMGVVSEAGLPGIADPGKIAVSYAHQKGIRVVPLPGPSSIIQALIASGFNGQSFTFHGYLPIDQKKRQEFIRQMHNTLHKTGTTQLFMETPYRNEKLIKDLLSTLPGPTLLSIAAGISGTRELIQTKSIEKWKKNTPDLHKIPAIFSLGVD